MGTTTKEPYGEEEIKYSEDTYLGRTAQNNIWDILRIRIIVPLREKGYVDVRERICDMTPVSEVRKELKDKGSAFSAFDAGGYFDKRNDSEALNFEYIADYINGYVKNVSVALDDDEIRALVCLIFKAAGNWKTKDAIINSLLQHFELRNLTYDSELKMIYNNDEVETINVDTIDRYIGQIQDLTEYCDGQLFFRGHGELWYKLLPSLFRNKDFYKKEKKLCQKLIESCPQEFANLHNHVDILAEMQHYNMPTRLMDVTSNALIALYFCCENESSNPGEVVLLDIKEDKRKYYKSPEVIMLSSLAWMEYEENQQLFEKVRNTAKSQMIDKAFEKLKAEVRSERSYSSIGDALNDLTGYYLVSPQKLNRRMVNQDGAFILCGLLDDIYDSNPFTPKKNRSYLEDLRLRDKNSGKEVILTIKNKKKIKKQLELYGINQMKIYPEIDKVAEYLKEHVTEM